MERDIAELGTQSVTIGKRLADINNDLKITEATPAGPATLDELQIRFIMVPTLILLGASIKLGKTTYSLKSLRSVPRLC